MHGIGRDLLAYLTIHGPRYAQQDIPIETDGNSESKQVTLALQPAQIITGRVIYADTGKPVSHARLRVMADSEGEAGHSPRQFPDRRMRGGFAQIRRQAITLSCTLILPKDSPT